MITEKMYFDGSKVTIHTQQDTTAILEDNQRSFGEKGKGMRRIASIPIVIAEQWAKECGAPAGTKEFEIYAMKKLRTADYSALRTNKIL